MESHSVIIVAPAIDSWRLFNLLSPCWVQMCFPLFCLAQVIEFHLPLAHTLVSQKTSVYSQQRCQVTGRWRSLTLSDEVDLTNSVIRGSKLCYQTYLLNVQTDRGIYCSSAFTVMGVFWKYRALTVKVCLSQRYWFFSHSVNEGGIKQVSNYCPDPGEPENGKRIGSDFRWARALTAEMTDLRFV